MKTKTVWKEVNAVGYHDAIIGLNDDGCFFGLGADVRWANCYGYKIGNVVLNTYDSKIIGDEDENQDGVGGIV